jgi:hypothetical protein
MFAKQDQDAAVPQGGRVVIQDTLAVLFWLAVAAGWTAIIIHSIWFSNKA